MIEMMKMAENAAAAMLDKSNNPKAAEGPTSEPNIKPKKFSPFSVDSLLSQKEERKKVGGKKALNNNFKREIDVCGIEDENGEEAVDDDVEDDEIDEEVCNFMPRLVWFFCLISNFRIAAGNR